MKKKVIVGICGGVVGLVVIIVVVLLLMRESFYTVTFMVDDSVYQTIEIEEDKTILISHMYYGGRNYLDGGLL